MLVITLRDVIKGVPKKWRHQYANMLDKSSGKVTFGNIADALDALDTTITTPDDIAAIIGNRSWTDLKCNDCGNDRLDVIVQVGQVPDYESATANLCVPCIKKAYSLGVEAVTNREKV